MEITARRNPHYKLKTGRERLSRLAWLRDEGPVRQSSRRGRQHYGQQRLCGIRADVAGEFFLVRRDDYHDAVFVRLQSET
jgi:hypothetical protein